MKHKTTIKILVIGLGMLLFTTQSTFSQDIHFSQMNFTPLTINPALAGANHDLEASLNYRTQWNSVADPFNTFGAAFNMRVNSKDKRRKKALFAVGLDFFSDNSGRAKIKTNHINLHFATQVNMDEENRLGIGIYGGWGQRSINPLKSKWASQYNGQVYDPTLPTGENFNASSFDLFDVGAGIVYTYHSNPRSGQRKVINVGFAAYHLNTPSFSFLNHSSEDLYMRFTGFAKGTFRLKDTKILLEPAVYFQQQGKAREIYLGAYGKYILQGASQITNFVRQTTIGIGVFYRNMDALTTKLLIEWNGIGIGFSYDFNIFNSLLEVSRSKGGFEIGLRWLVPDIVSYKIGSRSYF